MIRVIALILALLAMPAAAQDRITLMLGSAHVADGGRYDGRNPGLILTWESTRADISIGAYRNSYGRGSLVAMAALPVITRDDWRLGLALGLAWYPQDGRTFPVHLGDVVPLAGLQLRHRNLALLILPGDGRTSRATIAAGLTFPIGG